MAEQQCHPVSAYWDPASSESACFSPEAALFIHGLTNTITDVYIYILPMQMVWQVQLPKRQRIGLIIIFGAGFLYVHHSPLPSILPSPAFQAKFPARKSEMRAHGSEQGLCSWCPAPVLLHYKRQVLRHALGRLLPLDLGVDRDQPGNRMRLSPMPQIARFAYLAQTIPIARISYAWIAEL